MDKSVFLSIIIPVYKVEKYLNQCVDSVLSQHLSNYEIILVDDGSPDGCPAICDRYAAEYDNIRALHKPNGGSSSARNAGMEAARGEYIMFMDSDDWWNPDVNMNAVFEQVQAKPKVEMFLLTSLDYIEGEGYFKRREHDYLDTIPTESVRAYYQGLQDNGNLEVHAATKIIKYEFLLKNNLFFKSGIKGEDNEWMIRLLRCLKNVAVLPYPIYIYRAGRADSITATIGKSNIVDLLNIVLSSVEYYADPTHSTDLRDQEFCFCAYLWFCALGLCAGLPKQERAELIPLFRSTASVCRYSNSKKTKAAYAVYRFCGIKGAIFVLGKYIDLKHLITLNKRKVA